MNARNALQEKLSTAGVESAFQLLSVAVSRYLITHNKNFYALNVQLVWSPLLTKWPACPTALPPIVLIAQQVTAQPAELDISSLKQKHALRSIVLFQTAYFATLLQSVHAASLTSPYQMGNVWLLSVLFLIVPLARQGLSSVMCVHQATCSIFG